MGKELLCTKSKDTNKYKSIGLSFLSHRVILETHHCKSHQIQKKVKTIVQKGQKNSKHTV